MRQVALEVRLIAFAIIGVMQKRVGIVKDVPLGEGVILVMGSELCQCPIGDVVASVCAIRIVDVEGEALSGRSKTSYRYKIRNTINY